MRTDDNAIALLTELTRQGVELNADGDRLRYRPHPHPAVSPDVLDAMRRMKADLLDLLRGRGGRGAAAGRGQAPPAEGAGRSRPAPSDARVPLPDSLLAVDFETFYAPDYS